MTFPLISLFFKPESPSKPELQQALKPFGFKNPSRVWKELSVFSQNRFDRSAWAEILPLLLPEFSKAPDPDLSVSQFTTFAEKAFNKSQLFQYLVKVPAARRVLA